MLSFGPPYKDLLMTATLLALMYFESEGVASRMETGVAQYAILMTELVLGVSHEG